jgi:hypothetical protein
MTIRKVQSAYGKAARKRYKRAIWIQGDGRYATVSSCGGSVTVMLHATQEKAQQAKQGIDSWGCGGSCSNRHTIVDLALAN